jgi:type IV pilus biogenesis/stability protein PilW
MNSLSKKFFLTAVALIVLPLLLAIPASSQSRAIRGKITDDKGGPIEKAAISIIRREPPQTLRCESNKKGEYIYMLGIQPGTYRVIVRKEGFVPQYKENVSPPLGEQAEENFQLVPGDDKTKLPFEYTKEQLEQLKKDIESSKGSQQFSNEVRALFNAGLEFYNSAKYAEAIEQFEKAVAKDPKQWGILSRIGDCYAKQGKRDEAIEAYKKAIDLNPKDSTIFTNYGAMLAATGKIEESQKAFETAIEMSPGSAAAKPYTNIGITFTNSGNVDKAIEYFQKAIQADPNYAEACYQLGLSFVSKNSLKEAIPMLQKYISMSGTKPEQVGIAKELIKELQQAK